MARTPEKSNIAWVRKTRLLDALFHDRLGAGVQTAALADFCGLTTATARRLLGRMESDGVVWSVPVIAGRITRVWRVNRRPRNQPKQLKDNDHEVTP